MLLISFVVLSVLVVVSAANTVICDRKTTAIATKNTAVFFNINTPSGVFYK